MLYKIFVKSKLTTEYQLNFFCFIYSSGYIETEIGKEGDVQVQETDETCEAPKPKDMIQLEVKTSLNKKTNIFVYKIKKN